VCIKTTHAVFFYFRKMFIFYVFSITLLSIQKENNAYKRNQKNYVIWQPTSSRYTVTVTNGR